MVANIYIADLAVRVGTLCNVAIIKQNLGYLKAAAAYAEKIESPIPRSKSLQNIAKTYLALQQDPTS
jgi:hypothetical protein